MHKFSPKSIYLLKLLSFFRELFLDIWKIEDIFEWHPIPLKNEPLIQYFPDELNLLFPEVDLILDLYHKLIAQHSLQTEQIIIDISQNIIHPWNPILVLIIGIVDNAEIQISPNLLNILQLHLNQLLPRGPIGDLLQLALLAHNVQRQQMVERNVQISLRVVQTVEDLLPVTGFQVLVAQDLEQRQVALKDLDFLLEQFKDRVE